MNYACCYGYLDVVTFLLENIDHVKLDVKDAMNTVMKKVFDQCSSYTLPMRMDDKRGMEEPIIKLILNQVNHDLLALKHIMKYACRNVYLDVVTFLLENIDHGKLDVKEAINTAMKKVFDPCSSYYSGIRMNADREKEESIFKLILEKVNHDSLELKEIMKYACCNHYLDVVMFLLENTDHKTLDVMEALNSLISGDHCDTNVQRAKNELLIELFHENVNPDLLDLKKVFSFGFRSGCLNAVTYLLENTDHKKLDIMEAVNDVNKSITEDDYDDMNYQRGMYEHLIIQILEQVNHDLLHLKKVFYLACMTKSLDAITYLLENTDHKKLAIMEAANKVCNPSIGEDTDDNVCDMSSNEELIKLLLQKVKTDLLDMEILMNEACRNGWLNIVRWLVKNIEHSMFDVDTAFNLFIPHDSEETLVIFKLLLAIISPNLFDIGTVIEQASRLNHTEKVLWLLHNKDSSLFEMKYVMNEACRNSNLQIMKYVMENMDKNCVDVRSAMNKACRSSNTNSLEAVKWLLDNIPHDMLDLKSAMNNACRYDNVDVVEWFWNNLDRKLFDVKTAWNNACYNCNEALLSYLINNMDENMLDKSKAMLQACRNYEEGDKVISLLFEQPNMNTPENCKNVLKEACVHSNRPIVEWLLENTDIQPSELKEMLIYTIKGTINKANDEEISDHKYLVWFILKHPKVKELERNNLSDVMEALSSIGQLDMVQWLWDNTEKNMFNMRVIINTTCESGKFEIVDWFLQNIDLKIIDVQTVMVESCGYGWLKIVKLLLSKFDRDNFDMNTSMDEACSYGRYEIVKFLLEFRVLICSILS
ncbi:Hypothetical predicted protein [Mytilus galloprovincialis]|uniref:Ankyrin repeat protein n=1 Tax=Mytilus galloprovincialis TaxID=29158 RepID=A0A8B6G3Z7_MYTGA|nr:Hypothetical predicted protein [Mytilus galloprovincialis]